MNKPKAPYNFVPFSNTVFLPYNYETELPRHDIIDDTLKSGEIHITMTADTPVFVSDGEKNDPHFVKNSDGKYEIPGSTVRGMVRENMTILGFGHINPEETMEDYQIFFRDMASSSRSTAANLKSFYRESLDVRTYKTSAGKTYSIPEKVNAGYLKKCGDHYIIQPVLGKYLRISRNHPIFSQIGDDPARTVTVYYSETNGEVKTVRTIPEEGLKKGILLFTGNPVGKEPNHLYIFPEEDTAADVIVISQEDKIAYQKDLEARANSLKAYYNVSFWELPKADEIKPVFYIRHEEHTYFGMSLFLRIGHRYSIAEGLPQKQLQLHGVQPALDYPHAILGYAGKDSAYRSRVSFGGLQAFGPVNEMPPVQMILGQPKPSWYIGYVANGRHYSEEGFLLRGYKQYWLKDVSTVPAPLKKNVSSSLCPLPKGTKFSGVIRFKNLKNDELGLLLWSLLLDKGCYQSIGMGKPYGYGRMRLTVDSLVEYDMTKLYSLSFNDNGYRIEATDQVGKYISAYEKTANELTPGKKKLRELSAIKDFLFIRSVIRKQEEVSYMSLPEYQEIAVPLENIKTVRENAKQVEKAEEDAKPDLSKLTEMQRKMYEAGLLKL